MDGETCVDLNSRAAKRVGAVLAGAAGASVQRRHPPERQLQRGPPGLVGVRVRRSGGRPVSDRQQLRRGAEPDAAVPERQPEGVPAERHALHPVRSVSFAFGFRRAQKKKKDGRGDELSDLLNVCVFFSLSSLVCACSLVAGQQW
jgi:hypothetical protein